MLISDPFLVPFPPERPGVRQRLFCFPFAGAGASTFREWPLDLPDDVHVYGIQLPGRENRIGEAPIRRLPEAAIAIAAAISRHADLPFALFGHSSGALIAFEVARALRNHHSSPTHLFVSGCRGPSVPERAKPIHALPDDAFIQELRRLGGTPEGILANKELMQVMLPTLRADFELSETYRYGHQESLECPITVLGGMQDREVENSDLPGWQLESRGPFTLRMFPGDHYFLHSCRVPLLRLIAGQLRSQAVCESSR
jgi:medium-chain acyl-[acyl-carrier-protein] hydrolase